MNADSLSRLPCGGCDHCVKRDTQDKDKLLSDPKTGTPVDMDMPGACDSPSEGEADGQCRAITRAESSRESASKCNWMSSKFSVEITTAQQSDHTLATVYSWLLKGERPTWEAISHLGPKVKAYWAKWSQLLLKDGVLYRGWTSDSEVDGRVNKLVLPSVYHEEAFKMLT